MTIKQIQANLLNTWENNKGFRVICYIALSLAALIIFFNFGLRIGEYIHCIAH